ncbi:hypothetical protein FJ364_04765 [Candidatus Dependentiae bacterium]|nr:hypothetical protein [Candidatus Dependentiae bacterium]
MSRKKPIREEFDQNIIGDQRFVDMVINNDGYLMTIRHIENNILISPVKELYIKEIIRQIKENYPERSSDPQKVSKDLDVISAIKRKGYFAFINFPSFTITSYVERINEIFKKDLIKEGEITHPYLNFENETFTKLSLKERFDFVVCLLFQGGKAAALEGYLNKRLVELTTTKQAQKIKPDNKKDNPKYINLRELFINNAAYTECLNALRNVKDPVITDDNRYLLGKRQKGVFTAWFEVVKLRQKFKEIPNASLLATLLNKEISNLELYEDGTTLNRNTTSMYKKYYLPLSKLII